MQTVIVSKNMFKKRKFGVIFDKELKLTCDENEDWRQKSLEGASNVYGNGKKIKF